MDTVCASVVFASASSKVSCSGIPNRSPVDETVSKDGCFVLDGATLLTVPMECTTVMSNTEGSVGSVMISGSSAGLTVTLEPLCLFDESRKTGNHPDTGPDGTLSPDPGEKFVFAAWECLLSSAVSGGLPSTLEPSGRVGSIPSLVVVTGPSCMSTMVDLLVGSSSVLVSGTSSLTVSRCIVGTSSALPFWRAASDNAGVAVCPPWSRGGGCGCLCLSCSLSPRR